ncbi:uncharacterized protein [Periplaneta americana]|uniref:uncharacterized protein n=1 Tax=Periplaneta americana TaxID=6978 RepID=UPI0037E98466
MNKEQSIRLIELYKNHSFLWDPKDEAYHKRVKRENAWKEMSAILQQPVSTLKSKMRTLMGSYRSERSREKKSRISGSGSVDIYESKWFAYKYFDFLKDKDNPNVTLDTVRSKESQEVTTELIRDTPPVTNTSTAASEDSTFRTPTTKEDRKRKKVQDNSDSDKMMGQALHILQSSPNASNDPYFAFALNLANELRKYDAQTLAHVKRAIANILFEADMGRMSS